MSVVHLIDTLTEWARQNVCEQIQLKVPPSNEEDAVDAEYRYKLATPTAFPMYVPTSEKLPPSIHSPFPSLCVRFMAGQDEPAAGRGYVDMQFCFSAWDPGLHDKDIYAPAGADPKRWKGGDVENHFRRTGDGWRDAWNFVDIALRAVESTTYIGEYHIDRSTPIKFGPLTEQEAIPDLYPLWFAWVSFRVSYPLTMRNIEDLNKFL